MKTKRIKLPRGIRIHKSGKLIVDVCICRVRKTKVFPTLEQAIVGREELKNTIVTASKREINMSAIIEMSNHSGNGNKGNDTGYRVVPASVASVIDVPPTPAPASPASSQTLTFPVTGQNVRTVVIEGKVWFVARDVALVLGYTLPAKAVREHCKGVSEMDTPSAGGVQATKIIPESDVYRLVMRSKLPTAEAFQDWVVEEVLPSLRQHGGYMMTRPEESPEDLMARALIIAQSTITQQKQALEVAKPIVDAHQRMTQGGTRYPIREAMRALRVPMRAIHQACSENGILRRELVEGQYRWWPTKKAVEKGYTAKYREIVGAWNYGFTAKGMAWLKDTLFIN